MNKEEAVALATKARSREEKDAFNTIGLVEKRIIEVTETLDVEQAAKVRDAIVWIVTFNKQSAWYEFAIDDHNGEIVRKRWSR